MAQGKRITLRITETQIAGTPRLLLRLAENLDPHVQEATMLGVQIQACEGQAIIDRGLGFGRDEVS